MASAQHVVEIDRPVEEVFDFLAEGTNNPRWQPPVIHTTRSDGPVGAGTAFRQAVRHPLGFTVSANYRVATFERPRTLALVVTSGGPIRPTQRYELTQSANGNTTVRATIDYRPPGIARVAAPLLAALHPVFAWETSWIDNARDILESRNHTSAARRDEHDTNALLT